MLLGSNSILVANFMRELLPELIQRGMRTVIRRFHFDRRYLFAFVYEKIYLHVVFTMDAVRARKQRKAPFLDAKTMIRQRF